MMKEAIENIWKRQKYWSPEFSPVSTIFSTFLKHSNFGAYLFYHLQNSFSLDPSTILSIDKVVNLKSFRNLKIEMILLVKAVCLWLILLRKWIKSFLTVDDTRNFWWRYRSRSDCTVCTVWSLIYNVQFFKLNFNWSGCLSCIRTVFVAIRKR